MKKILSLIGSSIVFIIMSIKLYFLTIEAYNNSTSIFVAFLGINLLWIVGLIKTYFEIIKDGERQINYKDAVISLGLILSGALVVYIFTSNFNLHSVIIVAIVGLFAGVFIKDYAQEVVIGTFLGMSTFLSTSYAGVIFASIITFIIFFLIKDVFKGLGGKMGTTAFVGGLITFFLLGDTFTQGIGYESLNVIYVLIIAIIAGVLTYVLNNEIKLGAIVAYSIVSLIGGIFLLFPSTKDLGFINVVFGASFIGMSSKKDVKSYLVVIFASFIFGFFSIIGKSFINVGGRGGTLALISVLAANNFQYLFVKPIKMEKEIIK